jgi:hypothetical protein
MSLGMEYVSQLACEKSYEARRFLLRSATTTKNGRLYEALETLQDLDPDSLEKELQPSDSGAYNAWYSTQKAVDIDTCIMSPDNADFRERAYLMWDASRLETHNLSKLFADPPVASSKYTIRDHEEMRESLHERSQVDRRVGAGYWAKGDFRRVVPKEYIIGLGRKWVAGSFTLPGGFEWIREDADVGEEKIDVGGTVLVGEMLEVGNPEMIELEMCGEVVLA